MKLISHRGNILGPNPQKENSLEYIDSAINLGYDVEIDIRHSEEEQKLYLGHDECQYEVSMIWLVKRKDNLWIHCKNLSSLRLFCNSLIDFNYFWHQEDYFTLTSKKYIWTYPGQAYTPNSVIVMPEWKYTDWDKLRVAECYGICSDYVKKLE